MDSATVSTLSTLVGNFGFPIVMCAVLFWYMNKQEERHKEQISQLSAAIDNNTSVMTKLLAKME